MKQFRNNNKKNNKKVRETKPFEGKINQLKREKLVLCAMVQFDGFKKALNSVNIDYALGDFYKDGIIIVKK